MAGGTSRTKGIAPAQSYGSSVAGLLVAIAFLALVSYPWADSQAEVVDVAVAIIGVLAVISGLLVATRTTSVTLPRTGLAWSAFVTWSLVAAVASGRGWMAFSGESTSMLGWFMIATLGVVGVAAFKHAGALTKLLARLAWMVVLGEAVLALAQLATGESVAAGTLPNSTYFGQAILLLLPWVLIEAPTDSVWQLRARQATVVAALVALAATGSRVAVVLALVWLFWYVFTRGEFARRTRVAVVAGALLAVAVAGYAFSRSEILGTARISALGVRPALWMLSMRAISMRPLWGWGPDGFAAGGSAVSNLELARQMQLPVIQAGSTDPHNLLAWIAVSTGVVGLLLFAWFAIEVVRVWRRRQAAGEDVTPAAWAVAGCVIVFLTAPIAVQVLPLLAMMLGLSLAASTRAGKDSGVRVPPWLAAACVALLIFASATFAFDALTRARFETASPEKSPAIARAAQSAANLWPLDAHLAYLASMHLGYAALSDQALSDGQQDLVAIGRASALDRTNSTYALERVRALRSYGAPQREIEAAFAETFARYPFDPLARAEYGLFLAQTGRYEAARTQLDIARLGDQTGAEERLRIVEVANEVLATK